MTPSNNSLRRLHFWAYRRIRQAYRDELASQGQRLAQPLERAFITFRRYSAGNLDWDNAYGGIKPLLDCLLMPSKNNPDGLGFVRDDSPASLPRAPRLEQLPAKRSHGYVEVEITSALEDEEEPDLGVLVHRWVVPLLSPSNNQIKRLHPQAYRVLRSRWRQALETAPRPANLTLPLPSARLRVIRRSARLLDWDNAYGGLKPVLDCLTLPGERNPDGLGYLRDDGPAVLALPTFSQHPSCSASKGTELQLYVPRDLP
ncbi:hypothetical protein [Thiomonas sp.]